MMHETINVNIISISLSVLRLIILECIENISHELLRTLCKGKLLQQLQLRFQLNCYINVFSLFEYRDNILYKADFISGM
jgi:hypothetical protein